MADAAKISAPAEPLKRSVSARLPPSTTSLPSPGSQTKRSSPAPMEAVSSPALPSMVSLPRSRSGSRRSVRRSAVSVLPRPPFKIVRSVFVNAPRDSSIRSRSLPRPPETTILVNRLRRKVKFGLPLSPTSTTRRPPEAARSAIRSPGALPVTVSVPRATEALTTDCASAASQRAAARTAPSTKSRGIRRVRAARPRTHVAISDHGSWPATCPDLCLVPAEPSQRRAGV